MIYLVGVVVGVFGADVSKERRGAVAKGGAVAALPSGLSQPPLSLVRANFSLTAQGRRRHHRQGQSSRATPLPTRHGVHARAGLLSLSAQSARARKRGVSLAE